MGYRRKELLEINQDNIAFTTITAKVPAQILSKFSLRKFKAFSRQTCSIVVNHTWEIQWEQNLLGKDFVDLPVLDSGCINRSYLATFVQCKMNIGCWHPSAFHKEFPSSGCSRKQMELKSLYTVFPAHTVAAFLSGSVHSIESKHILDSANFNTAPYSLFNPLSYPPLVASLSS